MSLHEREDVYAELGGGRKTFYQEGRVASVTALHDPATKPSTKIAIEQRARSEDEETHAAPLTQSARTLTPELLHAMRVELHPEEPAVQEQMVRDGAPATQAQVVVEQLPLFPES